MKRRNFLVAAAPRRRQSPRPAEVLAITLSLAACQPASDTSNAIAIVGASVWSPTSGRMQPNTTILVQNGTIAWVGPADDARLPAGARILDGEGRYVIPGLVDMHYHLTTGAMRYSRNDAGALDSIYDRRLAERLARVALAHGVTTVRDPGGSPYARGVELKRDVGAGRIPGPRIRLAGDILMDPGMPPDSIRASIRRQAADGVDYIKVYAAFSPDQVAVAVDEAHRHGLGVIGHLALTSWTEAADLGIDFITHGGNWHSAYVMTDRREDYEALSGGMRVRISWYEWLDTEGAAVDSMIRALAEHRVPVDPTLVAYHTKFWWRDSIYQRDPDVGIVPEVLENWRVLGMHTADWSEEEFDRVQAAWPRQLRLVKRMFDGGVLLTTGSDLASPWVIPGVALHQELALLTTAGIPASEVLRLATINGAEALGAVDSLGTIEAGKFADLVILASDPTADIRATRDILHVMKAGVVFTPEELLGVARDSLTPTSSGR